MKNKTKTSKARLYSYMKGFKLPFVVAVIGAIVSSVITVIGPNKLSEIVDLITKGLMSGIDIEKVTAIAFGLAILYIIAAIVSYGQSVIIATVVQRFSHRLRKGIAEKINRLPLRYFDSHSQGDTLSRVTNDVDMVSQSLNQGLMTSISSSILLIAAVYMMFTTNVTMATTAVLSVIGGFILSIVVMAKSQPFFKRQQANLAQINGFIEETYSGHSVISSYNATQESVATFETLNHQLYDSMWKSQFISGMMMPLMIFIGNFGYVVVCVVGAILALENTITIGTIVAFMTYVRIFSQPLSQLAQSVTQMQAASAAIGRVMEFLTEDEMIDERDKTRQLSQVSGDVRFEHVQFGYHADNVIIHDFSAHAKKGQKVAIVGPTGAGKTTIVNLLMKFYETDKGSIQIDGIDIRKMKREEVHEAFAMVLQDTWLFEGTVRENLVYNQVDITDQQVVDAAKAVGVHHFIQTLPKGYDTMLDDSITLSAGQKQLLTIARALLKDAPLLILDEATSSVDTRTEELLQKAMDTLMEGRTSFVIAHRLSTIKNADLILVMRDGNIIEQGNHEQLMKQAGFYSDLYRSQFMEQEIAD